MIAILLTNLVIFIIALRKTVSRVSDNSGRVATVKSGLRATAVLMPLLGLTWAIGVFAVDSLSLPLAYTFTILNSLQGLLVLIFHCLLDKGVQKSFKRMRRRWSVDSSVFTGLSSTDGKKPRIRTLSILSTSTAQSVVIYKGDNNDEAASPRSAKPCISSCVTFLIFCIDIASSMDGVFRRMSSVAEEKELEGMKMDWNKQSCLFV
jgi:hypothetical protein